MSQQEKAIRFHELHHRDRAFVIPNAWDAGSARALEHLGFEAIATTSSGFAWSIGKRDRSVERDAVLAHAREMAAATTLPVSADLENCYADSAGGVAETIRLAGATGLAGGSIEDARGEIYELEVAVERVRAAVEAARALPFKFTLTARAENFIAGRPDLADTIKRLQAYQEAGADVLFAPGLTTREQIRSVVQSIDRPLNVLVFAPTDLTLDELSSLGVKRVSVGGSLYRAAFAGFLRAAKDLQAGTFGYQKDAARGADVDALISGA
jgi:2-methylisocitrate lyase-like PEP mutase family enzyme